MSFPRYPEYKDSGVEWLGQVPGDWIVTPLRRIPCRVQTGPFGSQLHAEEYVVGGTPVINPVNLAEGRVVPSDDITVGAEVVQRLAHQRLRPGDVIFSRRGELGRCALVTEDEEGWLCGTGCMIVRFEHEDFDPGYLSRYLSLQMVKSYFESFSIGAIMDSLSSPTLLSLPMIIPTIGEQRAVSAFVDRETAKIDALIAEQQRLMELLQEKRQAVISHAVTKGLNPDAPMKPSGVEWLGVVPVGWEVVRLKHVSPQVTVGIVVEPSKFYVDEGVPALRSLNISPGAISLDNMVFISAEANDLHSKSRLRSGDLVVVRSGQPGTTAIIPEQLDGCNCIDLIVIRKPRVASEKFLCWFLASDAARTQFSAGSGGAIQQHFNVGTAEDLLVVVPPPPEQLRIADFLDCETRRLDELASDAKRAIELLQERRAALISAAVTGEIDVRGLVLREAA